MMILILVASHTLMAAMVAVMMAAFSSGKFRDLDGRLQEERAFRAELVRRYNNIIATYGLAEPLIGTGGDDPVAMPSIGFKVGGKAGDVRDVATDRLR